MPDETPHPEQPLEAEHLRATLDTLHQRRDEVGNFKVQGFTTHDTAALHRHMVRVYEALGIASKQLDRALFIGTDLPDPGPDNRYQLWTGTGDPTGDFLELTYGEWRQVIDTNLSGAFLCSQRAARRMVGAGNGGRIIRRVNPSPGAHDPVPVLATRPRAAAASNAALASRWSVTGC